MEAGTPEEDTFVRNCAQRVKNEVRLDVEVGDLVAYGYEGLLEAKKRYDPSQGVTLEAFAYSRVRGAIINGMRLFAPRSPRTQRACERLARMDGIAEEAGREHEAELRAVPERRTDPEAMALAFDAVLAKITASCVVTSAAEVERNESPEDALITELDAVRVKRAARGLSDRDQALLRGLYWEDLTLKEVGEQLGISESRASRLHAEALKALREMLG